jgi:hypothetical protein
VKIGAVSERHTLLKGVNENLSVFYDFRPIWIKFGTVDVHKNVLRDCELRENRLSECHTLLTGVNKFLSVFYTFVVPLE